MALANLIKLGGIEFTDDGRTFSEDRDERAVEVELANGNLVKYVKASKRTFAVDWSYLPQTSTYTSDHRGARNDLRPICYTGATTTLEIRNALSGGSETYTVFVDGSSEELVLRDSRTGNLLYNVSLSLKEQ